MEKDKQNIPEKKTENTLDKSKNWIEKTEDLIDEATDKMYNSNTYKKAGRTAEKATLSIFRKAGKWWGKSERYFKDPGEEEEQK